jgi:uncharacterized protein YbcV (DUF1398 family)
MFTVDQIKAAHSKVKNGSDCPNYMQDLIKLGIISFETFVKDSHSVYFGINDFKTESEGNYPDLEISETANKTQFISDLKSHQKGDTDYKTFCKDCAKSGIEKWVVKMDDLTCTYFDKAGNEILVEVIPG